MDSIRSALNTVYGEDDLQWDLASDIFPRKVRYEQPGSQEATLRVLPSPIWDERGLLEKILFVVEDITQLEALESQINDQRAYAAMFEEVLSNNLETLAGFFERTFDGLRNLRAAAGVNAAASFLTILRDLHTLKGNARLFKLKLLSEQVHESESRLGELKGTSDAAALASGAQQELEKIEAVARKYEAIQAKIKGGAPASSATFNEAAWEKLTKLIPRFEGELSPAEFRLLAKAVRQLRSVPFSQLLAPFVPMVDDLAAQLGKKATITLPEDGAVDPDLTEALKDCFLHILRNSLDHGLETPSERAAGGKPEAGKIVVDYIEDGDGARIVIQDDGRGIDPERVLKKALEKKILTDEAAAKLSRAEKIALIFAPGFSTRDEATDLSGRGLGLDIVKSEMEKLGGTVTVDAETGKGSTFTITLPPRPLRAAKAA